MEEQNLLSKKELLTLTGISYGQLYRWKRQNLIPESWFIKQSSFTGQETFFPKDKILKRVEAILKLKDQYSLEELAERFSPELTNKVFRIAALGPVKGLDQDLLQDFSKRLNKDSFIFRELLFIYALREINQRLNPKETERAGMITTVMNWLSQAKNTDYRLLVCQTQDRKFCLLLQSDSGIFLDQNSELLVDLNLNELSNELHRQLTGLEELE
jgi:hypothetical protein